MSRPVLAVVYDVGGTPLEIARGLADVADVVFVARDSVHTREVRPLLEELAPTVDLTDVPATTRLLTGRGVDGVVTFSEPALVACGELGRGLGVVAHAAATTSWVTDKAEQRARLRERGVDPVRTDAVSGRDELVRRRDEWPYPVVVKPRLGGASSRVMTLHGRDDTEDYAARLAGEPDVPLHVEEFLAGRDCRPFGDVVSVETATFRGETRLIAMTGNFPLIEPFRETGHLWPAPLEQDEQIVALDTTLRAIDALGITDGITHTEFKLTAGGPRLIEVNARLGGFINEMCVSDPDGDLFAAAGSIALGRSPWDRLPRRFAPYTFVFMQEPPLDARAIHGARADRLVHRMASRYKTLHSPPAALRDDLGTEWLDAFVAVAPDRATMFDRVRDVTAHTSFLLEFDDDDPRWVDGSDLPSAAALPLSSVLHEREE